MNGSRLKHNSFVFVGLKTILCDLENFPQMLFIYSSFFFKLDKDEATKAISSTYPNARAYYVNATWQPRPDCFKSENSSSIYKLNSKGEITPPCFTPFDREKLADVSSPHCTWHNWLLTYYYLEAQITTE